MSQGTQKHILFLCTGNSCRSQMGEGLLRHLAGDKVVAHSAGVNPSTVNPLAIGAMKEIGVDISGQRSKSIQEYLVPGAQPLDLIITVCANAKETCPVFPRPVPQEHIQFDDPADAQGTDVERLPMFRRVRDEIKEMLEAKLANGSWGIT